jgi:hypothetical protein
MRVQRQFGSMGRQVQFPAQPLQQARAAVQP